jgi:ABC-type spermidine/putrescine transport system permease subunit II
VWAFSNYVVSTQVAVAAAVAVSVLGVVAALAVIAYQRPGEETALVRQTYASKWAGL